MLSATPDIYALQMASDKKIYVCRSFSPFLGVINDPSVPGTGCNYIDNGVDLDPNFMGNTSASVCRDLFNLISDQKLFVLPVLSHIKC